MLGSVGEVWLASQPHLKMLCLMTGVIALTDCVVALHFGCCRSGLSLSMVGVHDYMEVV